MYFNNKVVIITGASSGIGAACALGFAKAAASLCLVGRNLENLNRIARKCEEVSNLKPLMIVADITSDEDVERIVKESINKFGKIDILINNAGLFGTIVDKMKGFDKIMATNVRGTYNLTQHAIPHLIKTKGNIVNISSMLSSNVLTATTPYCMSKAAIDMFTKCLALQLGPEGVRVNAVNPGAVETELFKNGGMDDDIAEKIFENIKCNTPLKRNVTTEDVVELIMFLSSDKAKCVTGRCHLIDSGISLDGIDKYIRV